MAAPRQPPAVQVCLWLGHSLLLLPTAQALGRACPELASCPHQVLPLPPPPRELIHGFNLLSSKPLLCCIHLEDVFGMIEQWMDLWF